MGRRAANAKKFIVSCRVNTEEMDFLQKVAKRSGTSISDLLRKSLVELQDHLKESRLRA